MDSRNFTDGVGRLRYIPDAKEEACLIGYYNAGDRMKVWGKLGASYGGFWGLLFGSAFLFIPCLGHVMVFGPLVGWIVGALESIAVVGGLSALGAGLLQHWYS